MQDDLDQPDAVQSQTPSLGVQFAAHRDLGIGDAVIAALAAKARVAWRLASTHAPKERLGGQINAYRDILQHQRLHRRQRGPGGFEQRQCRLLIVEA